MGNYEIKVREKTLTMRSIFSQHEIAICIIEWHEIPNYVSVSLNYIHTVDRNVLKVVCIKVVNAMKMSELLRMQFVY